VVAVPSFTVPVTVTQNVEVPFVASTCPAVPVALLESRNSPVSRSLSIVEDARNDRPEAVNVTVEVPIVEVLAVR
jgi:hypothetical protein